jgi:hypothetical protein
MAPISSSADAHRASPGHCVILNPLNASVLLVSMELLALRALIASIASVSQDIPDGPVKQISMNVAIICV